MQIWVLSLIILIFSGCKGDNAGIVFDPNNPPPNPTVTIPTPVPNVNQSKIYNIKNIFVNSTASGGYKVNLNVDYTPQQKFSLPSGYSVELSIK